MKSLYLSSNQMNGLEKNYKLAIETSLMSEAYTEIFDSINAVFLQDEIIFNMVIFFLFFWRKLILTFVIENQKII